ncbi:hypothetical protein ACQ4PT_051104 [Festuca glaucescens]
MAGCRGGWINWDTLREEAEEDAAGLNYHYEFVVLDQEEKEEEVMETDRRRGGRLGLAGGVRSGRGHVHVGEDGGQVNGQARLFNSRHGLAHRVRSIVNRTMAGVPGEGSSSHGRSRLGLTGRRRVRAPVTQWPPQHVPNQGGSSSDPEEHVDDEPEDASNEEPMENGSNGTLKRKRNWYKLHQKQAAYVMLLERTSAGVLSRGVSEEVSALTNIPVRTLVNWWTKCKTVGLDGLESKRGNSGRQRLPFDAEAIKRVDLSKRTTLQDLAIELNMSKTTLWRRLNEGLFRRHTNAIKSTLTDDNKVARVRFCLSMLEKIIDFEDSNFKQMYNVIHIDEKWFYRTRGSQNYYLALGEEDPFRSTQSKNFIEKVMFLAAVARPRFDANGNVVFDGKLGIWPFTYQEAAKRKSKNREAGTMIQQDNAKTHIPVDDPEFVAAAQADGWDIRLTCQPPNSPDLNILDLGFFAALQSIFHKLSPGSVDDIVHKVQQAFEEYPAERSNRIFLTLQACMREVLIQLGGNRYKVPHMRKEVLERLGTLPVTLQCTANFVKWAIDSLPDA